MIPGAARRPARRSDRSCAGSCIRSSPSTTKRRSLTRCAPVESFLGEQPILLVIVGDQDRQRPAPAPALINSQLSFSGGSAIVAAAGACPRRSPPRPPRGAPAAAGRRRSRPRPDVPRPRSCRRDVRRPYGTERGRFPFPGRRCARAVARTPGRSGRRIRASKPMPLSATVISAKRAPDEPSMRTTGSTPSRGELERVRDQVLEELPGLARVDRDRRQTRRPRPSLRPPRSPSRDRPARPRRVRSDPSRRTAASGCRPARRGAGPRSAPASARRRHWRAQVVAPLVAQVRRTR